MESDSVTIGQIVHSKAGRDKNKYFIVVSDIGNGYVLISDGDIRKIEKPKKKKIKHLVFHNTKASDIRLKFEAGIRVSNGDLKNALKSLGLVNQSNCKEV